MLKAIFTLLLLVTVLFFQNCGDPFTLKPMSLSSNDSQSNSCLENPTADECAEQNLRPLNCDTNENETCFFSFSSTIPLQDRGLFLLVDEVENSTYVYNQNTAKTRKTGSIVPRGPYEVTVDDYTLNKSLSKAYFLVSESNRRPGTDIFHNIVEIDLITFESRVIVRSRFDYGSENILEGVVRGIRVSNDEESLLLISQDLVSYNGVIAEVSIATGEANVLYTDPSIFQNPGFRENFQYLQIIPTENNSEFIIIGRESIYDEIAMESNSEFSILRVNVMTGSRQILMESVPEFEQSFSSRRSRVLYKESENSIYYGNREVLWKVDLNVSTIEQVFVKQNSDIYAYSRSQLRIWEDQESNRLYGIVSNKFEDIAWTIDFQTGEEALLLESRIGEGEKLVPYGTAKPIRSFSGEEHFYFLNEQTILKVDRHTGSREAVVEFGDGDPVPNYYGNSFDITKDGTKAYIVTYNQFILEINLETKEKKIISSWSSQNPEFDRGSGPTLFAPYSGELDPSEEYLYLIDQNDGGLYRLEIATGNRESVYNQEAYTELLDYRSLIVSVQPERSRVILKTYDNTSQLLVELDIANASLSVLRRFDLTVKNFYDGQVSLISESEDYFHVETDEGINAIDLTSDELQIVPDAPIGRVYGYDRQRSAIKGYSSDFVHGYLLAF